MNKRHKLTNLRYHLWKDTRSVYYFYAAVILAYLIFLILNISIPSSSGERYLIGLEGATIIYLFVCGLHSFRERLYMFLQHGFSRRTMVGTFCVAAFIFTLILALIDTGIWYLLNLWTPVKSTFQIIYAARNFGVTGRTFLLSFLWNWSAYFSIYMFGFLLACINFRITRTPQIALSIVIPVIVIVGFAAIDQLTGGAYINALYQAGMWLVYGGLTRFCPWCGIRTGAGLAVIFMVLSYLFCMRVSVRRSL